MINIRAFGLMLTSLAAIMFLSPEPTMKRVSNEIVIVEAAAPSAVGKATEDVVHTASDAAAKAGERIRHLGSAAYDKLSSATEEAARAANDAEAHALHLAQEQDQQHPSKMQRAKEMIRERLHEAARYQPNLGQGVGYYGDAEGSSRHYDEAALREYLEGAIVSARDAMEQASSGLGVLEAQHRDSTPTIESAMKNIRDYYDTTKGAVLEALSKQEHELGSELSNAQAAVEKYYDSAKERALSGVENEKESLGQYLDMVVQKLNAGRRAIFNYGMSSVNSGKRAVQHGRDVVLEETKNAVHSGKQAFDHGYEETKNAINTGKQAVQHGKDLVLEGVESLHRKLEELEEEAARLGSDAKGKVNESLKHAGRWAHDKAAKLNETEEMALALVKQWLKRSITSGARLVHLFGFCSIFGSSLWVTFVSGFALARSVTRHQFGVVQSKIFPVYFRMVGSGLALLLSTHMLLHPPMAADDSERFQYYNLAGCLGLTLMNAFMLEPRATKAMFDRLRLEKDEGREQSLLDERARMQMDSTNRKLGRLHTFSSTANILVLVGLAWHLWYLNCRLVI